MRMSWLISIASCLTALICIDLQGAPRISILVPHLDSDVVVLEGFLDDITRQTIFPECELIIMSSSRWMSQSNIVKAYLEKYSNIIWVDVSNGGVFHMLNYGIKNSAGDYITYAQISDRRDSASLELQVAALEADPGIDLVYSDYRLQSQINSAYGAHQADWLVKAWDFCPGSMYKCLPGPHALWRRSLHEKYGLFEPSFKYSGDWEMWLRAVSKGARFKKISGISGVHCGTGANLAEENQQIKDAENAFITATYSHVWQQPFTVLPELSFVIVVPSYNNSFWFEKNLASLLSQKYENFKIIYCDDCSTDGMSEKVIRFLAQHPRGYKVEYIKNQHRVGALENIYNAVWRCRPTDIIVLVDGDDWCAHSLVLSHLNVVYHDPSVWMTYGQFKRTDGQLYRSSEVPLDWIRNKQIRQYPWTASHLRTFYAGLFQRVKKEDLLYIDGRFFPMGWDLAMMYPMIEMAQEHSRFIPHLLYMYNTENPINDHKVNYPLQYACDQMVRAKQIYEKLDHLF